MRNKRTLQRGLALLLAGGMALSGAGAVPALAEEYAPETVQATPETAVAEETPAPTEEPTAESDEAPTKAATEDAPAAATDETIAMLSSDDAGEDISTYAATTDATSKTISIDFSQMESLDDLGGWQLLTAGGTVTLAADPADANSKALAITHTARGAAGIQYDGLGISASDYRYVTVSETFYLTTPTTQGQFCLPYLYNGGTVGYTLLTDGSWDTYKAQIDAKKNTKSAGAVRKNEWQTVNYSIDLQSNTFTVKVDGETTLENATARNAVDQLTKFAFYSDDNSKSTVYLKSVTIKAEKDNTGKEPDKVYPPHAAEPAVYYVSNDGDDDAAGTSSETAWQTLDRVNAETFIPGDKILFERGGEWNDKTLSPKGSGTADAYITIGAYGANNAARPKIAANGKVNDALYLYNQQYWEICDLDISNTADGFTMVAGDTNPDGNITKRVDDQGEKLGDYRGIHIAGNDIPSLKGFNIHDVRVHDVSGEVAWISDTKLNDPGIRNNYGYERSKRTGGIMIESLAPSVDPTSVTSQYTVFSDITIADSEIVNNSFGGIVIKQYNNEKEKVNGNGWTNRNGAGGAPDYYDPNWHPHTNIVITGNYINQGASAYACNGIYLCGVKDSVIEKNMLEHLGTCGIELFFADNVAIQYNEVTDVQKKGGGADDNAIDPDWRTSNILIQYNYLHDCGEGILLCGVQFNSGTVRYNLIKDTGRGYVHYSTGKKGKFIFHNNIFYRSKTSASRVFDHETGGTVVSYTNNIFYDATGEGFQFKGDCTDFSNNAFYGCIAPDSATNSLMLTESPFVGSTPADNRKGDASLGALLEANGLQLTDASGLAEAGASQDSKGVSLSDGLLKKGTLLNYSSLLANYGDSLVPGAAKAYPVFTQTGTDATLNTEYTQAYVNPAAPSVGIFERALDADDIILAGTVTDTINTYPDADITVTVGGKIITTTTDSNGCFFINEGLAAGDATVTAVVDGETYTQTITLVSGKSHRVTIAVPIPTMPDPYPKEVAREDFENDLGILQFTSNARVENGQLVLTPPKQYKASVFAFSEDIQALKAVDFSYDFKFENNSNKAGLQFRDSEGHLLFATCVKTAKAQELRTSTTAETLTDDSKAAANGDSAEPKWTSNNGVPDTTYTVRVHADFAKGRVSYQILEKDTGTIVAQQLNAATKAKNLAKMYNCNWYNATKQYIDNFVLTTPNPVDKTTLQAAYDANSNKSADAYTEESWKTFADALKAAQDVLDNETTTQEQVDAALTALNTAADALVAKLTEPDKPDNKPTEPDNKPSEPDNKPSAPVNPTEPATPTQPTATPSPTQAPTVTPKPTADSTTTSTAPAAQTTTIPQTADTFPQTLVLLLTLGSAAMTALTVYGKKKH